MPSRSTTSVATDRAAESAQRQREYEKRCAYVPLLTMSIAIAFLYTYFNVPEASGCKLPKNGPTCISDHFKYPKEWYTVFSAMLAHIHNAHVGMNAVLMIFSGAVIEMTEGHLRTLVVVFGSQFVAMGMQCMVRANLCEGAKGIVGASGACCSQCGA